MHVVGGHCKRQSCANKGLLTQLEAFLCGKWRVEFLWFSDATMYHTRGKARDRQRLVGLGLEFHVALHVLWHGEKERASTSRQYSPVVFDVGDPETTFLEMFPSYRMQHYASAERELLYIAYHLIHRILKTLPLTVLWLMHLEWLGLDQMGVFKDDSGVKSLKKNSNLQATYHFRALKKKYCRMH